MTRLTSFFAAALLATACATPTVPAAPPAPAPAAAAAVIPVDDLETVKAKLAAGAVLVDVRPTAWAREKPMVTTAAIPFSEAGTRLADFEALVGGDKSKPVVVACGTGSKALEVKALLLENGFTDVSAQAITTVARPTSPAP